MREIPSQDGISRFSREPRKQRSKRALDYGAELASSVDQSLDLLNRATLNLKAGYLSRVRVMEARFVGGIIQLQNQARAIDGVMFRREAWVARSGLVIGACCRLMPYGQGGPARVGTRVHYVNSVGHEMVSLPAPVPRRDIIRSQRRSLCFLLPTKLAGRHAVGVSFFVKFGSNFTLLRREVRNDLPWLISCSGGLHCALYHSRGTKSSAAVTPPSRRRHSAG